MYKKGYAINKQFLTILMLTSIISAQAMDLERGGRHQAIENQDNPSLRSHLQRAMYDSRAQDFEDMVKFADKPTLMAALPGLKERSQGYKKCLKSGTDKGNKYLTASITTGGVSGLTLMLGSVFIVGADPIAITALLTASALATLGSAGASSLLYLHSTKSHAQIEAQKTIQKCIASAEAANALSHGEPYSHDSESGNQN